jgi:flagellar basal-body rod protein FlgB
MNLFDATLGKLETALDLRLERQNLLSSNVANADTPGYVPRDFDFAKAMAQAEAPLQMAQPEGSGAALHSQASATAQPQLTDTRAGFDGNRVDADQAMVALAENGLQYGANAQATNKKLAILLYAASDGTT